MQLRPLALMVTFLMTESWRSRLQAEMRGREPGERGRGFLDQPAAHVEIYFLELVEGNAVGIATHA